MRDQVLQLQGTQFQPTPACQIKLANDKRTPSTLCFASVSTLAVLLSTGFGLQDVCSSMFFDICASVHGMTPSCSSFTVVSGHVAKRALRRQMLCMHHSPSEKTRRERQKK